MDTIKIEFKAEEMLLMNFRKDKIILKLEAVVDAQEAEIKKLVERNTILETELKKKGGKGNG